MGELAEAFNIMAARLNEYEHSNLSQLLFEKQRIDTIINNMKDAIIGLNERKEIIFSNTIACRITGIESRDLVGKYAPDVAVQNNVLQQIIKDIMSDEYRSKPEFSTIRISADGKPDYYTREVLDVEITRTGETLPVNVGAVIILKNITRFLEQDEAKTNFISTISHELKTPISSIKLNLKLLDDQRIGMLNEEQKDIIKVLKKETGKMLAITSELLDLAQVESGNIQMEIRSVHPLHILDYVMETSNNQAKPKHIRIDFESEPDLPHVVADAEKTAWVLLNLINNSVRYSDPGSSVLVTIHREEDEVIFKVQDHGKGIEKQYLDKIFEKFFRVPGSAEDGTGLGLAISKEFIGRQKGRIWAESEPGLGSRFYFSLPVHNSNLKQI
jgi:PAS domain S-box-containing protein